MQIYGILVPKVIIVKKEVCYLQLYSVLALIYI